MRSMWFKMMRKWLRSGGRPATGRPAGFAPRLETLGDRIVPAVTASFTAATGVLTVFGDALDNNITVSRDAAGCCPRPTNGYWQGWTP